MTRFGIDPPDDDGPDPNRCTCGDELVPCPAAGDGALTCLRCDHDIEPDSERTQRADHELDRQRDDALLDRLEQPPPEVPF